MSDGIIRLRKTGVVAADTPRAGGKPAWFVQLEGEAEAARGTVGDCMARAFTTLRAEHAARARASDDARRQAQAEEQARRQAEEHSRRRADEEARRQAEAQARAEAWETQRQAAEIAQWEANATARLRGGTGGMTDGQKVILGVLAAVAVVVVIVALASGSSSSSSSSRSSEVTTSHVPPSHMPPARKVDDEPSSPGFAAPSPPVTAAPRWASTEPSAPACWFRGHACVTADDFSNVCYVHIIGDKRYDQARQLCTHGLKLNPSRELRSMLLYNLCLVDCNEGDFFSASAHCAESLSLRDHPEVRQAQQMLKSRTCRR